MLERNDETGTYTVTYDWSEISPSTAIMEAVSAIEGTDPVDLDPLHRIADPDAINRLLAQADPEGSDLLEVDFQYSSVRVSARNDGTITLHAPKEETNG